MLIDIFSSNKVAFCHHEMTSKLSEGLLKTWTSYVHYSSSGMQLYFELISADAGFFNEALLMVPTVRGDRF